MGSLGSFMSASQFSSASSSGHCLVHFNSVVQAYGAYLNGFRWNAYGCLTFRTVVPRKQAFRAVVELFRSCGSVVGCNVAYIAVPEWRTSGCGMPPIPLHWHVVAAGPPQKSGDLLNAISQHWSANGKSQVRRFQPAQPGAYYWRKRLHIQTSTFCWEILTG